MQHSTWTIPLNIVHICATQLPVPYKPACSIELGPLVWFTLQHSCQWHKFFFSSALYKHYKIILQRNIEIGGNKKQYGKDPATQ